MGITGLLLALLMLLVKMLKKFGISVPFLENFIFTLKKYMIIYLLVIFLSTDTV